MVYTCAHLCTKFQVSSIILTMNEDFCLYPIVKEPSKKPHKLELNSVNAKSANTFFANVSLILKIFFLVGLINLKKACQNISQLPKHWQMFKSSLLHLLITKPKYFFEIFLFYKEKNTKSSGFLGKFIIC